MVNDSAASSSPAPDKPERTDPTGRRLDQTGRLTPDKVLPGTDPRLRSEIANAPVVLVVLAAGKGTRFGQQPKCIQPVLGRPLARHSIENFRSMAPGHNSWVKRVYKSKA